MKNRELSGERQRGERNENEQMHSRAFLMSTSAGSREKGKPVVGKCISKIDANRNFCFAKKKNNVNLITHCV